MQPTRYLMIFGSVEFAVGVPGIGVPVGASAGIGVPVGASIGVPVGASIGGVQSLRGGFGRGSSTGSDTGLGLFTGGGIK